MSVVTSGRSGAQAGEKTAAAGAGPRPPGGTPGSLAGGTPAATTATPAAMGPTPAGTLTNRERFLKACGCRAVDRAPVWLMRQGGGALPEYRALKEKHSFLELVQTPELAAEVTLQPIRRFDFDAAILFCDILAIADGLGQRYQFRDEGVIEMEFLIKSAADVERLEVTAVTERLRYVAEALVLLKARLDRRAAPAGVAGSPWTLANFMMEGGGVKEYGKAKALFYANPQLFGRLMEKLTRAITAFLWLQIEAGADAVQIFDSLGWGLCEGSFREASGRWMKEIVNSLKGRAPVIVFSKGTHGNWDDLMDTGAQVLGLDGNVRLAEVRERLPEEVGVQGNLDPFLLSTKPETVAVETGRILEEMRGRRGHIFNLGHGVAPNRSEERRVGKECRS